MEKLKTKQELLDEIKLYARDSKQVLLVGNLASINRLKNIIGENPCIGDLKLLYKEEDGYGEYLKMNSYDGISIVEDLYHHIGFKNPLYLRVLHLLNGENTNDCKMALQDILNNHLDRCSIVTLNK